MGEKYIVFLPTRWDFQPDPATTARVLAKLRELGIVAGRADDPTALTNGPGYERLFRDTDRKPALDGVGFGCDPGKMSARIDEGRLFGYAGDNMEPVACEHCNSELPYEEAQDGFYALRDGEGIDSDRFQMECYHCEQDNSAFTADYGLSAGYAHWGLVFTGETSNRVEPNAEGMKAISDVLGSPIKFIQIFNW